MAWAALKGSHLQNNPTSRSHYLPHFTNGETEAQRLKLIHLDKVTQLIRGKRLLFTVDAGWTSQVSEQRCGPSRDPCCSEPCLVRKCYLCMSDKKAYKAQGPLSACVFYIVSSKHRAWDGVGAW